MKTERVTTVRAGETIQLPEGPDRRLTNQVVGPPCATNAGYWCCATHGESFANNFQKDSHIHRGRHPLPWVCYQPGPGQP